VVRTPAILTSHPLISFPSGTLMVRPCSLAPRSITSISANRMRSSYPEAVGKPETIISSITFSALMASFFRFVSSSRSSEDEICLFANDSRNYSGRQVSYSLNGIGKLGQKRLWRYLLSGACLAKTLFLLPYLGKESFARGVRRCISGWVTPSLEAPLRRHPT